MFLNLSNTYNIFILHSLINLYLSTKKKQFCTLIDISRALDTILRLGIWQKLIENNITSLIISNDSTPLSSKYCSISFIKREKRKGKCFSICLTPTLLAN
jgi:hypothetical protein